MDAKPQRPSRAIRLGDENAPLDPVLQGKQIKQNDKAAPTLSTLMQTGAQRGGTKRAAFNDVSNTNKFTVGQGDHGKDSKSVVDLKQSAATLLKPAQKPLATKVAVQSLTTTSAKASASSAPSLQEQPAVARTLLSKRSAAVLKDNHVAGTEEVDHVTFQDDTTVEHAALLHLDIINEELDIASGPVQPAHVPTVPSSGPESELISALEEQAQSFESDKLGLLESQAAAYDTETEDDDDEQEFEPDEYTRNMTGGATATTIVLAPRYTKKVQDELNAAKILVESSRTAEELEDEQWDMSMVAEYGEEIFSYMRKLEDKMRPNAHYMDFQQDIQWSMRSVLVDWVIQVHHRFQLLPETLFLAVNYIDRFLSVKVVSMGKLQLVGATALFLAAKYEEVNCPSIAEIVYMVDHGYSVEEILKAERFMLSMLHFELGWPGPMSFLRRISKADDYDLETRTLAKYFLEITICDERFLECVPSFTAAGAHCLARLMLRKGEWTSGHVFYSNYTYSQIRHLLATLIDCLDDPETHHNAVFQKYTDRRFKRASLFVQTEMQKGFKLQSYPFEFKADPTPRAW